jgi:predicted ATPase/class 3 adenylate cyclase
VDELASWLARLGLEALVPVLQANDIDLELLPELTEADLEKLGLSLGHRKKLLKAAASLPHRPASPPAPSAATTASVNTASSAERRQLTVMFCDLVGSTALASRLDPEDLQEVIGAYHKCAAQTVGRFDGFVAKYMGDGVLVYFGYPRAHEDDAERAVQAGLALIEAVGRLKIREPLQVRVGIATGLVVVGDLLGSGEAQERGVVGETPNLAARLQALAEPNTVVIGPSTRRILGDLFEYRSLGAIEVKGFTETVQAYQVLRSSTIESRFEALHPSALTPLVGRTEESELLHRRWLRAKSGDGQAVLLSGEPGIGKSRMTATVLEQVANEPHTRLRYFCSPHHSDSAFSPIISQLERAAGFEREDDSPSRFDKLDALLSRTSTSMEDRQLIADLLSLPDIGRYPALDLSPQQRKQRTFQAFIRQLEALARQQPVLMIFEDMHWIDPTSQEAMNRIVERIRQLPVLLLMTFRPEFNPPWIGQPHVTIMALNRLDQHEGAALVERIVGDRLPAEIVNEITERTDGIPLFVEELTKALLELGLDGRNAANLLSISPSAAHAVPTTLQASLMARLDRLGSAKEVAQIGAVIGREFPYELLAAVSSLSEPELRAAVDQLTASGLVSSSTSAEASYLFKHALVQDAAYSTLLRRTRQQLHARIAEVLEERFPDRVAREPELLAHHFAQAQQMDRAAGYWLKAGRQAVEHSANLEAIRHLSKGLEGLKTLSEGPERDRQELAAQIALGTPLIGVYGYAAPETGAAYRRGRVLCERLEDAGALFATLSGEFTFHFVRGDYGMMLQLAEEARRTSERMADAALRIAGHRLSALTALHSGAFAEARSEFETILRLYDPGQHRPPPVHYVHDAKISALPYLAIILWIMGYPEQAQRWSAAAFDYAGVLNQANLAAHVRVYGGAGLDELRRDTAAVRRHAEAIVDLAEQHSLHYFRLSGLILRGWAMVQEGAAQEGLTLMRQNATERHALGVGWYQIRYLCMLAEAHLQHGAAEEGLSVIAEAKDLVARNDDHMWEAELKRVEGELWRAQGASTADIGAHFQAALGIARDQSAKSFELRAAISLARLWRDQGKRAEARDVLAPVHGWFTEGFDTPDLLEAKALLDELS